jgi:cytochrome c oxidase subunit II
MPDTHHAYDHVAGVYFPIAIAVLAIVLLTLAFLLVRGRLRRRPGARSEATVVESAYALLLAGVVAFLLYTTFTAETPIDRALASPGLRVRVLAAQWSWRFEYPGGLTVTAVSSWAPPVALVPTGTEVEFDGVSQDVIHGFWVPQLRYMRQLFPGHSSRFDLIFHEAGLYGGVCSVFCGQQHTRMHFELEAVPPAEFRRWLSSRGRAR